MFESIPAVPVTNDSQRLRSYIYLLLPILKKKEIDVSHTHLQKLSLSSRISELQELLTQKTWEIQLAFDEKEFYQKFAEVVLKERDDVLHAQDNPTHSNKYRHLTWHSCCHQSHDDGYHTLSDLFTQTPLISVLRGEKLEQAYADMKCLSSQLHIKEQYVLDLRKQILDEQEQHKQEITVLKEQGVQLNLNYSQQMMFNSTLERQMKEKEMAYQELNMECKVALKQLQQEKDLLKESKDQIEILKSDLENQKKQNLYLEKCLIDSKEMISQLQDQQKEKVNEIIGCQVEIESLKGEIDLLQRQDINQIITKYSSAITKLKEEFQYKENEHNVLIDKLYNEIYILKNSVNKNCSKHQNLNNLHNEEIDNKLFDAQLNLKNDDADIEKEKSRQMSEQDEIPHYYLEPSHSKDSQVELDCSASRISLLSTEDSKSYEKTASFFPYKLIDSTSKRRQQEQELAELDKKQLLQIQAATS